jgi:putative oxidoreductase
MSQLRHIVTRDSVGADILRIVLCMIIFTHGAYRFYEGTTPIMGTLLENAGFPFGTFLAYAVNVVETAGALLLALRLAVLPASMALVGIYFTGIMLFHRHSGFFVVGPGENGWEYSALLITCLLFTAWENHKRLQRRDNGVRPS